MNSKKGHNICKQKYYLRESKKNKIAYFNDLDFEDLLDINSILCFSFFYFSVKVG